MEFLYTALHNFTFYIAGNHDDSHGRVHGPERHGEIVAAQFRKQHVRKQNVDGNRRFLSDS